MIFIDIKTTGSKSNLPFMFDIVELNFNLKSDKSELRFTAAKTDHKTFVSIPEEDELVSASFAVCSFNNINEVKADKSYISSYKEMLTQVYSILSDSNRTIVSFNGEDAAFSTLNELFKKYDLQPLDLSNSIDLLKLSRKLIDITKTGNMLLLTLLIYLLKDSHQIQKIKEQFNEYKIAKLIFVLFLKLVSNYKIKTLDECFELLKTPMVLTEIPIGKYRGMQFSEILKINPQYLSWMYNNEDIKVKYPDIFHTLTTLLNSDIPE